jgi:hypothetical protein
MPHEDDIQNIPVLNRMIWHEWDQQGRYTEAISRSGPFHEMARDIRSGRLDFREFFAAHVKDLTPQQMLTFLNGIKWIHPAEMCVTYRTEDMQSWLPYIHMGSEFMIPR